MAGDIWVPSCGLARDVVKCGGQRAHNHGVVISPWVLEMSVCPYLVTVCPVSVTHQTLAQPQVKSQWF